MKKSFSNPNHNFPAVITVSYDNGTLIFYPEEECDTKIIIKEKEVETTLLEIKKVARSKTKGKGFTCFSDTNSISNQKTLKFYSFDQENIMVFFVTKHRSFNSIFIKKDFLLFLSSLDEEITKHKKISQSEKVKKTYNYILENF